MRVRIAQGGEVAHFAADRLSAAHLDAVSLNRGRWILLEPAPGPIGHELAALVDRLASRGASTIVAHPERHAGAGFEDRLRVLAARGCLLQWTADFLVKADPATRMLSFCASRAMALCICSQVTRTRPTGDGSCV